jgi:hypothetical protein
MTRTEAEVPSRETRTQDEERENKGQAHFLSRIKQNGERHAHTEIGVGRRVEKSEITSTAGMGED